MTEGLVFHAESQSHQLLDRTLDISPWNSFLYVLKDLVLKFEGFLISIRVAGAFTIPPVIARRLVPAADVIHTHRASYREALC